MSDTADTLERFVDHLTRGFTPELAKHFAELPKPNPEFQARLDELASRRFGWPPASGTFSDGSHRL